MWISCWHEDTRRLRQGKRWGFRAEQFIKFWTLSSQNALDPRCIGGKYTGQARSVHLRGLSLQNGSGAEYILSVIEHHNPRLDFSKGKHEIIGETVSSQYGYPLKVVFSSEKAKLVVITAYPLKRGLKNEDSL